jgi:hypothetical protein
VTFDFSFMYFPGPGSTQKETANGTVVFNKNDGTYIFDLENPIQGETTFSTSSPQETTNYDTQGNNSPEIVVQKYSDDFFGVLTAWSGPNGNPSGLGTTVAPNLAYAPGDLLENDNVNFLNVPMKRSESVQT